MIFLWFMLIYFSAAIAFKRLAWPIIIINLIRKPEEDKNTVRLTKEEWDQVSDEDLALFAKKPTNKQYITEELTNKLYTAEEYMAEKANILEEVDPWLKRKEDERKRWRQKWLRF